MVSRKHGKLPGNPWLSTPATRLVGVLSPDPLEPFLGDEEGDLGKEANLCGEEANLGDEEPDLMGDKADLDGEEADLGGE